jgi:hypothetical protein
LGGGHGFGDGRSPWIASTPNGRLAEGDAVTTKFVPGRVVAWQSTPSSTVRISCTIRVLPERDGGTCVRVAIDYSLASVFTSLGLSLGSDNSLLKLTISQVAPILPYLLLVLILIFRPKGLLGTREG